tara:strand:+ start:228 stop:494 length:267 start_codon:yes stop_codon:yes gene_type:complete
MILTTTEAQEVADLITDITTSIYMLEDDNKSLRQRYMYLERKAKATIALSDKFGIDLPALDICRDGVDFYCQRADELFKAEQALEVSQ